MPNCEFHVDETKYSISLLKPFYDTNTGRIDIKSNN